MTHALPQTLTVLNLSKNVQPGGGVLHFVRMSVDNASRSVHQIHFPVGRRSDTEKMFARLLRPIQDSFRLYRVAVSGGIDVVQINTSLVTTALLRDAAYMLTLRAARFQPVLLFVHGWNRDVEARLRTNALLRFVFRNIFGAAHLTAVLAPEFRQSLISMGFHADNVITTTAMFDGRLFDNMNRRDQHPGEAPFTILFMSRLVCEKGVYELLAAFKLVLARLPNSRLVLAGDGPERSRIEGWIEEHQLAGSVRLPGYLQGVAKARALMESDLFVFPTYEEGCPISLLEAMAAGLPVVTTAVGGIPHVFDDGENGILLNDISANSLAQAMERLINDPPLRARIAENNRRRAWTNYEARIVVAKLESAYQKLIDNLR